MASDERKEERFSLARKRRWRINRYAWPLTLIILLAVAGAIIHYSMNSYEHISAGLYVGYVGPAKCKECHKKQYASWKKTRMANTFEVLRPGEKAREKRLAGLDPNKDYTNDESCLPCHTTGYGFAGGFFFLEKKTENAGVPFGGFYGF